MATLRSWTDARLASKPARVTSLHQDGQWTKGVASMWAKYRAMRSIRRQGLSQILQAWQLWTSFRKDSQPCRKEARARKQCLVDEFLVEAQGCAIKRDISQWYKRVRTICPKNKLESIHLRSDGGELLSPEQSLQELHEYYAQLFHYRTYQPEPLPPMSPVPFTEVEIARRLTESRGS